MNSVDKERSHVARYSLRKRAQSMSGSRNYEDDDSPKSQKRNPRGTKKRAFINTQWQTSHYIRLTEPKDAYSQLNLLIPQLPNYNDSNNPFHANFEKRLAQPTMEYLIDSNGNVLGRRCSQSCPEPIEAGRRKLRRRSTKEAGHEKKPTKRTNRRDSVPF